VNLEGLQPKAASLLELRPRADDLGAACGPAGLGARGDEEMDEVEEERLRRQHELMHKAPLASRSAAVQRLAARIDGGSRLKVCTTGPQCQALSSVARDGATSWNWSKSGSSRTTGSSCSRSGRGAIRPAASASPDSHAGSGSASVARTATIARRKARSPPRSPRRSQMRRPPTLPSGSLSPSVLDSSMSG
jgi:hypothetical protein